MARFVTPGSVVTGEYPCALGPEPAGLVQLVPRGVPRPGRGPEGLPRVDLPDHPRVIVVFDGEDVRALTDQEFERLVDIVADGTVEDLYAAGPELAEFYCPPCGVSYCNRHWSIVPIFEEDGWYDESIGTCPNGHQRRMLD